MPLNFRLSRTDSEWLFIPTLVLLKSTILQVNIRSDFNSLVLRIKSESEFYPFAESFSKGGFDAFTKVIDSTDQKAIDLARFILKLSQINSTIGNTIFALFDSLALTRDGLIDLLFGALNRQYLLSSTAVTETLEAIAEPFDMESFPFLKIENELGEPVSLVATQEVLTDATAELIRRCERWIPGVVLTDQLTMDREKAMSLLERAWILANTIVNLRDNILSPILFDQQYIEWTGEKSLRLAGEGNLLDKLRVVADIRSSYHKQQAFTAFRNAFVGTTRKRIELRFGQVRNGQVSLIQQEAVDDRFYAEAISLLMTYHPHLAKMGLSYFQGLNLSDLASVYAVLLALFKTYAETAGDKDEADDTSSCPAWVDRDELLDGLTACTGLPTVAVAKLVDCLVAEKPALYFWKAPFYQLGNRLYFALPCFVIPNHDLYYDSWIAKEELSADFRNRAFRDFVVQSLKDGEAAKFSFGLLEDEQWINDPPLRYSIVCRLQSHVLLLEIITFDQPVEYPEHSAVLDILSEAVNRAKAARGFIGEQYANLMGERAVLAAVLSAYPTYSGLTMNDVPIIDENLLLNYLFSGEISKNSVHFDNAIAAPRAIASYRYYENEVQFNDNLARFLASPPPVRFILDNLTMIDRSFAPLATDLVINIGMVDRADQREIAADKIQLVDQLLTYSYYREPDPTIAARIETTIQYHFALLVHKMAFSTYVPQEERWSTLDALFRGKGSGDEYLVNHLIQATLAAPVTLQKTRSTFQAVPWDSEAVRLFERLIGSLDREIELSAFSIPPIFNEEEERMLISMAMDFIEHKAYQYIDENDIRVLLIYLATLYGFMERYDLRNQFYSACGTILQLLNNSYHFQKAGDLGEEILFCLSGI